MGWINHYFLGFNSKWVVLLLIASNWNRLKKKIKWCRFTYVGRDDVICEGTIRLRRFSAIFHPLSFSLNFISYSLSEKVLEEFVFFAIIVSLMMLPADQAQTPLPFLDSWRQRHQPHCHFGLLETKAHTLTTKLPVRNDINAKVVVR